jgi:adenylosuccinate lyase
MRVLFTEEARLQYLLNVEVALASVQAEMGLIPKTAASTIRKFGTIKHVKLDRVKAIEKEIHHDVMAIVKAFAEKCGDAGKFIHVGATSYDIVDTANALQFRDALSQIQKRLVNLLKRLIQMAEDTKDLTCVGRTHGQHALPTTYGMKFAIWASEVGRHLDRLKSIKPRVLRGKMSGAVGTQAGFGEEGLILQDLVMKQLGLVPADISNQIIQRDTFTEIIFFLSLVGATLEKISKEIRNLQRTEIAELAEPFAEKQVGSSTMSHKRNPHKSERICGLARILRGYLIPAFENISLEHERDLTNSSVERIIFPTAFNLLDYMLSQQLQILIGLEFFPENISKNVAMSNGMIMVENVMLQLVSKGIGRQEAHEILRISSIQSKKEKEDLKTILTKYDWATHSISITPAELDEWFKPENYLGTAKTQVEKVSKSLREKIKKF